MRVYFKLIAVAVLLLSVTSPALAEEAKVDLDVKADIQILEERIVGESKVADARLDALDEKLDIKHNALKRDTEQEISKIRLRIDLYLAFVVTVSGLFVFFGFTTIKKWIKQTVEEKAGIAIEMLVAGLKKKGESDLDKLTAEHKEKLNKIKRGETRRGEPLLEDEVEVLDEYAEELPKAKKEVDYTFDDWYFRGLSEFEKKEWENTTHFFSNAIKINPASGNAYFYRGVSYTKLEMYGKAIEDYDRVLELNPKDAGVYYNRGVAYGVLKEFEKAIEDYSKAIKLDPKLASPYLNLSEAYIVLGHYTKALDSIKVGLPRISEVKDKAIGLYLECIACKLLNMDTSGAEGKLDEVLKEEFELTFYLDVVDSWLEEADIPKETKDFIQEKTDLMKKHG